ncbi:MAG: DUF4878 domain-containing protein [Chloroflexi bacterium]|nr:DUF4878 domain-containing protein [Chloroflexota bacterium]
MKGTKGLLAIVLLLGVLAVSAGCAKSDAAAIEDTVKKHFAAWNARNFEEHISYFAGMSKMSEQEKANAMSKFETAREMMGELTLQKIENVVISDSTAKADVTATIGNTTNSGELTFVKEDGIWKIVPTISAPPSPPPG